MYKIVMFRTNDIVCQAMLTPMVDTNEIISAADQLHIFKQTIIKKTMTYPDGSSMILRECKQTMLFFHHYLHGLHLLHDPTKLQQFQHNQCEQLQSKLFDLLCPCDWDLHLSAATAELYM